MIHVYQGKWPTIHASAFIAPGVHIIGDVKVGEGSSVWYNAVLRGDLAPIEIGANVNIQDGVIGHVNRQQPLIIDDEVSVGHQALIHGCKIGKGTLIGMGAIILNGAEIGEYALIGAGSLVTEGKKIHPYTLSFGSPAKVIRELTEADLKRMQETMKSYVQKTKEYKQTE